MESVPSSTMLAILFKATILLTVLLYSDATTMNPTTSKFLTTLRMTSLPDTTPENTPTDPQTVISTTSTDYQTMQTSRPTTSITETPTSTVAETVASTATTTMRPPPPSVHRIPTRLEEKLESLSCDIPPLPSESRLWRGNETHELMLPITVSKLPHPLNILYRSAGASQ